jgi:multiple sugar transport system permease protein
MINQQKLARVFFWILLTSLSLLFFLPPILWMISSSFTHNDVVIHYPPQWLPENPTLENFIEVFTTQRTTRVSRALWNSGIVALATVLITLLIDSLAAYSLARMKFKGRNVLFLMVLIGLMIPAEVTFIPLVLMLHWIGWLNSYQALILPAAASPFGVFLLRQFFLSIPRDLEDAARIDGCGRLRILFRVILPLSKPALATLAIFTFLISWNNFLWPLIVITEPGRMTVPVILAYYMASFKESMEWATLMASAFIVSLPPVIIFLFFQRQFVQGITLSGMKG